MTRQEKFDLFIQMRQEKKTYQEIADFFGTTRKGVATYCRIHGLQYSEEELKEAQKRSANNHWTMSTSCWEKKIKEKWGDGVSFVSVVERIDGEAKLKCKCNFCEASFVIAATTLRHDKGLEYQCKVCADKKKKEEKVNKAIEKQGKTHRLITELKGQSFMSFCSCGLVIDQGHKCCDQCKRQKAKETRRRLDRKKETKRRMRCKGGDWSITLKDLYERDYGICYLCGCRCDWRDGQWKDGAFIVGPTYPSIEHVVPLSKGGTHEWNNVKLACWICNTRKGAR